MKNQTLTIEQMQTLADLGINTSNASMRYERWLSHVMKDDEAVPQWSNWRLHMGYNDSTNSRNYEVLPAFTVGDMMEMLPLLYPTENGLSTTRSVSSGCTYYPNLYHDGDNFFAEYISNEGDSAFSAEAKKAINSLYDIMVWLLENKHKLNTGE